VRLVLRWLLLRADRVVPVTGFIVGLPGMLTGFEGTTTGSEACLTGSIDRAADFCGGDAALGLNDADADADSLGSCDGMVRGLDISGLIVATEDFVGEALLLHRDSEPVVVTFSF